MTLLPVASILLPVLGAGGVLALSVISRLRPYLRYLALVAVFLSAAVVAALRRTEPLTVIPSLWQPSPLFGTAPALQTVPLAQPPALGLELITLAALLAGLGRRSDSSPHLMAVTLVLLSSGLVAVWSANIVATIISWAIYDLVYAVGHIAADGSARTGLRSLVMGNVATLLLWLGALLSEKGTEEGLWNLITPNTTQLYLWTLAGTMRLWVYPFHLSAPDDFDTGRPLVIPFLLGPVIGWRLWLHLIAITDGMMPDVPWLPVLAIVTIPLGGFLAWSGKSPACILSCVGISVTGEILLTATLVEEQAAAVVVAGSVAWMLALGTTFLRPATADEEELSPVARWLWRGPSLVGALTLLGLPGTMGFLTGGPLVGGLASERSSVIWAAFFVGNLFLVPALFRWLWGRFPTSLTVHSWRRETASLAAAIGVGGGAILLVVAGLYPPLLTSTFPFTMKGLFEEPGPTGWLLWSASLVGGGLVAWQERNIRRRIGILIDVAHDFLRLGWLYSAAVGALDKGVGMLRTADEVVEGAGALLWSWLLFLLVLLLAWRM